jgi:MoaA/NifB/PqqE/SkfB family radical SAM enzyme
MTLKSLSLFVGTAECNARCRHCAALPLRKYAPKKDGIIEEELFYRTIKSCYERGARSLSISSSGEPTLSPLAVTKTLELICKCGDEGIRFSEVHLYSNGIRIGEDKNFSDGYLPLWKHLGLATVYVTVHDVNEKENAKVYGIEHYPQLGLIFSRIHSTDLLTRANLVLTKKTVGTLDKFVSTVQRLREIGVDNISAWPIRNLNDEPDVELSPSDNELDEMEKWIENNLDSKCKVRLLRERNRDVYRLGHKLTLFPDGTLSNSWCDH